MRLPADAALLILNPVDAPDAEPVAILRRAWEAEQLPILDAPPERAFIGDGLESWLDNFGATTLVICGFAAPEAMSAAVRAAAGLGFRLFVVAEATAEGVDLEALPPNAVRIASLATTLQACEAAHFRRRWRAARDRAR